MRALLALLLFVVSVHAWAGACGSGQQPYVSGVVSGASPLQVCIGLASAAGATAPGVLAVSGVRWTCSGSDSSGGNLALGFVDQVCDAGVDAASSADVARLYYLGLAFSLVALFAAGFVGAVAGSGA